MWTPTGREEVRGTHRITYMECVCGCGVVKWVQKNNGRPASKCCRKCSNERTRIGMMNPDGRVPSTRGWLLTERAVAPADLPLYEAMKNSKGYLLEHRLVMARHLGRPLGDEEYVLHANKDYDDNRLDNLILSTARRLRQPPKPRKKKPPKVRVPKPPKEKAKPPKEKAKPPKEKEKPPKPEGVYAPKTSLRAALLKAQAGDPADLLEYTGSIAKGVCRRYARYDHGDWDDVAQQTCVAVFLNSHKIDPDGNVFSYITSIARNEARAIHQDRWLSLSDVRGRDGGRSQPGGNSHRTCTDP